MTIWRMRIACWIPKATNTLSEYVILTAFPLQHWFHERPTVYFIRTLPVLFNNTISPTKEAIFSVNVAEFTYPVGSWAI